MNFTYFTMGPKKQKRKLESSNLNMTDSSDNEDGASTSNTNFSKFIVLTSKDENKPLSKVSPFVLQKLIHGTAGSVHKVKKLRNGSV